MSPMSDMTQAVAQCLLSGALFGSLCALLVVPPGTYLAVRRMLAMLRSLEGDPGWQAPLAAVAAALPGGAFFAIAVAGLVLAWRSQCLLYPQGRAMFAVLATLAAFAIVRAAVISWRRHAEVRALLRAALPASPAVARIGRELGVAVREVAAPGALCAVAGAFRPVVLVSHGTLGLLSDRELRAALSHEAAHVRRFDPFVGALIDFFVELFPLKVVEAVRMYCDAREAAADRHAVRGSDCIDLASAIVAIAKGAGAPQSSVALHGRPERLGERVERLLGVANVPDASGAQRAPALASLAAVAAFGFFPVLAMLLDLATCTMGGYRV